MSIEFDGLNEVLDSIDNIADIDKLNRALTKTCLVVEAAAKQKAPKGNGELRRSITSKVEDLEGVVFTPLEYAPYVEYGTGLFAENGGRQAVPWKYKDDEGIWHSTSGMRPHPYMRPALEENREKILTVIKEGLGE
ncbi:MAG: HK97 gp10 family phage protein [Campylobacter sp.]|uniref:HK97-gp10 family putative phage morphogenesis protein n=1 Tax=Campylobacter sp. TaxID=205 RepID=UPI001B23471E|nr:HK97-gp10 family putative phage morphogenesis protein [Campylobacter sp.]MBO5062901.1 HK97 gp10 family phage protein [Campylobacter sp.]